MPTQSQIDAEFARMNRDDELAGKVLTKFLTDMGISTKVYRGHSAFFGDVDYYANKVGTVSVSRKCRPHRVSHFVGKVDCSMSIAEQKKQLERLLKIDPPCDDFCQSDDDDDEIDDEETEV